MGISRLIDSLDSTAREWIELARAGNANLQREEHHPGDEPRAPEQELARPGGASAGGGGGGHGQGDACRAASARARLPHGGPHPKLHPTRDRDGCGVAVEPNGDLALWHTIIADNTAPSEPNCRNAVTSLGNNLESTDECGLAKPGDQVNTDPQLGLLQDNGGPTDTLAPAPLRAPWAEAAAATPRVERTPMQRAFFAKDIGSNRSGASNV